MKISEARHPDLELIKGFVRGEASRAENRELVRHLLHGCSECQRVVRESWPEESGTNRKGNSYPRVWERSLLSKTSLYPLL